MKGKKTTKKVRKQLCKKTTLDYDSLLSIAVLNFHLLLEKAISSLL